MGSLFLISEPSNTATAAEMKSIVAQSEKKQYNTIQKDDNNNSEQQQPKSLTPKEVLKTPLFYQIWMGYFYDKLSFKKCFMIIGFVVTVATASLPVLPLLGKETSEARAGYTIMMSLLFMTSPGIYSIVAAAVNEAFGPDHYKANFGLLFTQAMAWSLVVLAMAKIQVFESFLGYTGMFLVAGGFGIIGLLVVCFIPGNLSTNKSIETKTQQYSDVLCNVS